MSGRRTSARCAVLVRMCVPWLAAAALLGCGARPGSAEATGIELLRRQAAAQPNDADLQRRLAEAELLAADGDAARAPRQIARARELAPSDERLHLLAAMQHQLHGELAESAELQLEALEAAARSPRPEAPHVAEVAAGSLAELIDAVPDYAERVAGRLAALERNPGRLGAPARHMLGQIRIELASRRGDAAAIRAVAGHTGCITRWRVAGPFGPRALLGFERQLAPEDEGPLEASYHLGPLRGTRETRDVQARGCAAHVGSRALAAPGASYAEAAIEVDRPGRHVLRLETPNAVEIFVDGRSVARLDAHREPVARTTFHELDLTPGRHLLMAKIATRHPNPVLAVTLTGPEPGADEGLGSPATDGPLGTYLAAATAMARGNPVGAREALRHTERGGRGSAAMLILRAGAALADPLRAAGMRRDEARRLLRRAAERDPLAWLPSLQLARLDAADGRLVAAIERLRRARSQFPGVVAIPLTLSEMLLQRGWDAEADRVIEQARRVVPSACAPKLAALGLARRRGQIALVRSLTEELVACDARSDARLTLRVDQRRWDEALEELDRLEALEPEEAHPRLGERLQIARGRGDAETIDRLLEELERERPFAASVALARADRLVATGKAPAAANALDEAIERSPASMAELRWARAAITGERLMGAWRVDGAEALERFEESGRGYEAPQILVLDYTVVRVFEDGSALELTHNIFKLESEEALDKQGEYQAPDGARVLTLRTIKADGRRLEPDAIEGKESISLPNLAPGDYVELEHVRLVDPPAGFPRGAIGERFYFRSFEIPFDRSELTVVVPEDMELTIDPRGPAPETEQRDIDGGLMAYRWKIEESKPLVQEPLSVPAREWVPSINWGVRATWEAFVDGLLDMLADRDVSDPAARRLALRLTRAAGSDEERARRLYRWVLDHVDDTDNVFGLAPAMLADRSGNRARVLHYLLGLAGVPSGLVLVRDAATDQTRSELADDSTYKHLLVQVPLEGEPTYLSTSERGAPFGYLPPYLRGQDGLTLASAPAQIELPEADEGADRHRIDVRARMAPDGSARVEVRETFRGAGAVSWRSNLEGIQEAVLEQRFGEMYVARLVPGASLLELAVEGRDDPDAPLVLHYSFEVGALGHREGSRRILPQLYAANLSGVYAQSASRTTTQLVAPPVDRVVRAVLETPRGTKLEVVPGDVTLRGPGSAHFSMKVEASANRLVTERRVRLPLARVAPQAYPDFARFCRQVDEAEAHPIAWGQAPPQ